MEIFSGVYGPLLAILFSLPFFSFLEREGKYPFLRGLGFFFGFFLMDCLGLLFAGIFFFFHWGVLGGGERTSLIDFPFFFLDVPPL